MKLSIASLILTMLISISSNFACAKTPSFMIKDIRIEGLQRTDPGTVFNSLPMKIGDSYDNEKATLAIKRLFATGSFNDIRIETTGNVVIISVSEQPIIADVNIEGTKAFKTDEVLAILKRNNCAIAQIYNPSALEQAILELKQQYYARGYYSVDIKVKTTKLERNRIALQLTMAEGSVAKIKRINIIGAEKFKEKVLKAQILSTELDWISWYTKTDQYSKQKLEADLESLRSFYLDRGYLEFEILSTHVNLSDNKQDVFLTIHLHEGEKYTVGSISFAGEILLPEAALTKLLKIKSGAVFSRQQLEASTNAISNQLGNKGYAFANVNAAPKVDKENHTVSFVFYVNPGRKTYVRHIHIIGNKKTRDEVIRRELRQMEAALYSVDAIKRSKERLEQLGYFSNVEIENHPVPGDSDLVDLTIKVTEVSTGSFNLGLGYGQADGLALAASLSQENFLGTGNLFSFTFNNSKINRVYAAQLINPYATIHGVSLGWSFHHRDYKPDQAKLGQYHTASWGGGITIGVPISEYNRVKFGLRAENLSIKPNAKAPGYIQDFVKQHGTRNWTYAISSHIEHNTLDNMLYPTSGVLTSWGGEISIPPSDIKYYRLTTSNKIFFPVSKSTSIMWHTHLGYGASYGKRSTPGLPFYENFHAGGVNSIRGYEADTLGPVDNNKDAMGGNRLIANNVEFLFPIPGIKQDKSTRLSIFWDAGYVFGPKQKVRISDLRHSIGIALTWISPIGPLKISYAMPLKSQKSDKIQRTQYTVGGLF